MNVVALVTDLMDRSRMKPGDDLTVKFVHTAGALEEAVAAGSVDAVVVDLRQPDAMAAVRSVAGRVHVVAFGAHVDTDGLRAARDAGADVVLARSAFFADPTRWLAG
jgi:hypothetical protein